MVHHYPAFIVLIMRTENWECMLDLYIAPNRDSKSFNDDNDDDNNNNDDDDDDDDDDDSVWLNVWSLSHHCRSLLQNICICSASAVKRLYILSLLNSSRTRTRLRHIPGCIKETCFARFMSVVNPRILHRYLFMFYLFIYLSTQIHK